MLVAYHWFAIGVLSIAAVDYEFDSLLRLLQP
jgi:hypothetical protein